jgi:hypothetical protein
VAAACAGVPGGAKVAALETPESALPGYAGVFIGRAAFGIELDFELAGGVGVRVEETGVTVFEDFAEFWVVGLQENGDVSDFDGDGLRRALQGPGYFGIREDRRIHQTHS